MRIYLDHNAGAPLRPEARAAMLAVFDGPPANPSSSHPEGAQAPRRLEQARAEVAGLLAAAPPEVVFTSGATEANNLALAGVLAARPDRRRVVVTAVEHASVLEPAHRLAAAGGGGAGVPVDPAGRVAVPDVLAACDADTALVSIGLANGEIGTLAPVAEIASALRGRGIVVHTDAAQAVGRVPVAVAARAPCCRGGATSWVGRPARARSGCVPGRRSGRSSPAARRSATAAPAPS